MLIVIFENGKQFYKDTQGNKYQYDLSNSMDRTSYSVDITAQMRDNLSVKVRDPQGGGIYE